MTGIARARRWETSVSVEVHALNDAPAELAIYAYEAEIATAPDVPSPAVAPLIEALDGELSRPWEAVAVRQEGDFWAAAGRRTRGTLITIQDVDAASLDVAVGPDGSRSASVDGATAAGPVDPALDQAFRELERLGRLHFQAFAARADNLGDGRWRVSIDPL